MGLDNITVTKYARVDVKFIHLDTQVVLMLTIRDSV